MEQVGCWRETEGKPNSQRGRTIKRVARTSTAISAIRAMLTAQKKESNWQRQRQRQRGKKGRKGKKGGKESGKMNAFSQRSPCTCLHCHCLSRFLYFYSLSFYPSSPMAVGTEALRAYLAGALRQRCVAYGNDKKGNREATTERSKCFLSGLAFFFLCRFFCTLLLFRCRCARPLPCTLNKRS